MLAKTQHGLEDVLERELKFLGATHITKITRGVTFTGDLGFLYKSNLWLRTALRILMPISEFKARNENEIYKKVNAIAWEDYFDVEKSIVVDATVFAKQYSNSLFIAQRVKDAIVDRFRAKTGQRPSVSTRNPDVRINIHIQNEKVTLSLDSSGDSLHKRGYRDRVNRAPINETLAAGILSLANWDKQGSIVDPMCGSGTFLIEAAMMAYNIPPGVFRKDFCFKNWKNFNEELYSLIFDKALEKEQSFRGKILGFDNDKRVLSKAEENIRRALMEEQIEVGQADFLDFPQEIEIPKDAMLIFNPPYGIKIEADIPELYTGIGDSLKNNFAGHTAWVFTASPEGLKNVGLKPSKKIQLYNGNLESWLVKYEMYEGSRKQKKA